MALSESQKVIIREQIRKGTSNRKTANIASCSESAVRTLIKKERIEKNAINALADEVITNTIKQKQTNTKINALKRSEIQTLNDSVFSKIKKLGISDFDEQVYRVQEIANKALEQIEADVQRDSTAAIVHLPNVMAIGAITEKNKKVVYGTTAPKDDDESEKPKTRKYIIDFGDEDE